MSQEQQSHLEEEAQETDTLDNSADGVSEDEGSNESSSETVHPEDGQSEGDTNVFHEEGGQKFKTKEELVQFYRQQRGAASRVARENKELKTRLEQFEAAARTAPQAQRIPTAEQIEKVDDQLVQAANALAKTKKFASPEEIQGLQEQIKALQQFSDQAKLATAQTTVNSFLGANQDAVGHEEELADLIKEYGLDRKGTEEGLRLAYQMFFGRPPKAMTPTQIAQQAYNKGQMSGVKKSQAGGGPSGNNGGKPANQGGLTFDWSLLD